METTIAVVKENDINMDKIREAAGLIKDGSLVAFPTETVYGLGGDALNPASSRKIYEAKGRPSDNPLIVHIADTAALDRIAADIPESALLLAVRFWPGPLTMVLRASGAVPRETTGGLDTVAVRMPSNRIALALIRESGGYIAAPSANRSGRPSPTLAKHVYEDMQGRIPFIIDGGAVGIGVESTIVDLSDDAPTVLRPGAITVAMLSEVLGVEVRIDPAIECISGEMNPDSPIGPVSGGMNPDSPIGPVSGGMNQNTVIGSKSGGMASKPSVIPDNAAGDAYTAGGLNPRAPGMKYRHYAPKGVLTLVRGAETAVVAEINRLAAEATKKGQKTGVIASRENMPDYTADVVLDAGDHAHPEETAHALYGILREMDAQEVEVIFSECFTEEGVGSATMNRLFKAAGYRVIEV